MTTDLKAKQIATWLTKNNTGLSSLTMLCCSLGQIFYRQYAPQDPDDFNRCLELLKCCPFVRDSFDDIAKISQEWKAIINNWHKIEMSFVEEAGIGFCKRFPAPKTYELIDKVLRGQE
jgi:hypothetical protein